MACPEALCPSSDSLSDLTPSGQLAARRAQVIQPLHSPTLGVCIALEVFWLCTCGFEAAAALRWYAGNINTPGCSQRCREELPLGAPCSEKHSARWPLHTDYRLSIHDLGFVSESRSSTQCAKHLCMGWEALLGTELCMAMLSSPAWVLSPTRLPSPCTDALHAVVAMISEALKLRCLSAYLGRAQKVLITAFCVWS